MKRPKNVEIYIKGVDVYFQPDGRAEHYRCGTIAKDGGLFTATALSGQSCSVKSKVEGAQWLLDLFFYPRIVSVGSRFSQSYMEKREMEEIEAAKAAFDSHTKKSTAQTPAPAPAQEPATEEWCW